MKHLVLVGVISAAALAALAGGPANLQNVGP